MTHRDTRLPSRRRPSRRTWVVGIVSAAYALALMVIALWPTPVDRTFAEDLVHLTRWLQGHGAPRWADYELVEFSANVALFIPLGLLGDLGLRHRTPFWVVAGGFGVSVLIEVVQAVARPERFATPADVLSNTLGVTLGVLIGQVARR